MSEIELTDNEEMLDEFQHRLNELDMPCWYSRFMYNGIEKTRCVKKSSVKKLLDIHEQKYGKVKKIGGSKKNKNAVSVAINTGNEILKG